MEAAVNDWRASFEHPFLQALLNGTLSDKRFRFYQMQDARYLEAYADSCSIISVRFKDIERKLWFIDGARLSLVVERELHEEYGRKLGYTAQDIANLELSPANRAYQNHLLVSAQKETLLTAVAALAPCPWLYSDIGLLVNHRLPDLSESHPYADWLTTYADPVFVTYTNELLAHLQFLADQYPDSDHHREAIEAFVLSTRYELMFWEQAWDLQGWQAEQDVRSGIGMEGTA
ncbi:MAG: thiaminase II [Rhodothermia bacterium]|nr:MAG: thiaminase II [Rhodothermia bacterium]